MKKLYLLMIPIIVSLLMISYVSASWFNNFDYYNDHNYKNLYDFLTSKKDTNNQQAFINNPPKVRSEFYQVNVHTWLNAENQEDNHEIIVSDDNQRNDNNRMMSDNNDNQRNRHDQDPIIFVQPSVKVIQKKVIYKKEIKQMMCDDDKCYIEYQTYYQ